MTEFNPNAAAAADSGVFGLSATIEDAALVLIPVPWEATTSYGGGTVDGPAAILAASRQVDLYDLEVERPYAPGIAMLAESVELRALNDDTREDARAVIEAQGTDALNGSELRNALARVNAASVKVNTWVQEETARQLERGKLVGLIGGDHAVPLGAFRAMAKHLGRGAGFGLLHFDAHSDTRDAYEGFKYSHASILRNALDEVPQITKLVQVGIRDVCEEEMDYVRGQGARVRAYTDLELKRRVLGGEAFGRIADEIVAGLPDLVWVTFDVDGLDPKLCPNTGTPVPGGLEWAEALAILRALGRRQGAGQRIIGFDLNEVAPGPDGDEWDANVGARLLYKLCAWTLASQGRCRALD